MDTSTWVALGAVVLGSGGFSALAGYLLAGRNERKRDDRAAEREKEALQEKQADEGRIFQRDTLLELHDLLYKLNRVTGRSQFLDETRYRETGRYARDLLPEELSDRFTELITSINRVRVRIFDRELRDLVDQYVTTIIQHSVSRGNRQSGDDEREFRRVKRESIRSSAQWEPLEENLGAAIRSQFPGSDLTPRAGLSPSAQPPASRQPR